MIPKQVESSVRWTQSLIIFLIALYIPVKIKTHTTLNYEGNQVLSSLSSENLFHWVVRK